MEKDVFEEFYPKIYNYVYYRVLHRENAEDITSEVFYKAIESEARFDPRRASYSTWLFTIAHNCVVNFYRSRKNIIPLDDIEDEIAAGVSMDETLIANEDVERLYELLKTLKERERTVLALRYWGGFSHAEIGRQTGLSEKNVSVILSRTIARLKALW